MVRGNMTIVWPEASLIGIGWASAVIRPCVPFC